MVCLKLLLGFSLLLPSGGLIAPLKTNNGETDVDSVATHVLLLEQMFTDFKVKEEAMMSEISSQRTEIVALKDDNNRLDQELTVVKSSLKNMNTTLGHRNLEVSFEVRQTGADIHASPGSTLHFDDITHNIGGAYHNTSGIFIAPVDGTYIFWAHIMVGDSKAHRIDLMQEGNIVATAYVNGLFKVASVTAAVDVKKNDQLWFVKESDSNVIRGFSYSSYGGVLLAVH